MLRRRSTVNLIQSHYPSRAGCHHNPHRSPSAVLRNGVLPRILSILLLYLCVISACYTGAIFAWKFLHVDIDICYASSCAWPHCLKGHHVAICGLLLRSCWNLYLCFADDSDSRASLPENAF